MKLASTNRRRLFYVYEEITARRTNKSLFQKIVEGIKLSFMPQQRYVIAILLSCGQSTKKKDNHVCFQIRTRGTEAKHNLSLGESDKMSLRLQTFVVAPVSFSLVHFHIILSINKKVFFLFRGLLDLFLYVYFLTSILTLSF